MAYSEDALSANEIAWAALDKPFLSSNALYNTSDDALWTRGSAFGGTASSEDEDPNFPTENLFDGFPSNLAKPVQSEQDFTIVFDRSSAPITFDWIGVINHNLYSVGSGCYSFRVDVSNSGTSGYTTISDTDVTSVVGSDRRFADMSLGSGTAKRYSNVPYIRIGVRLNLTGIPQIGQIVFGRRRQQQFQPDLPYDPQGYVSNMHDFESDGGVINRVTRYKSRSELTLRFRHSTSAEQSDILEWWDDIEGGEQPVFFCPEPNSNPNDFLMMMADPRLPYPYNMVGTRDLTLMLKEQGQALFVLE